MPPSIGISSQLQYVVSVIIKVFSFLVSLVIQLGYVHCDIMLKCLVKLNKLLSLLTSLLTGFRYNWLLILIFLLLLYVFVNDIMKVTTNFVTEFATLPIFIFVEVVIIIIYAL